MESNKSQFDGICALEKLETKEKLRKLLELYKRNIKEYQDLSYNETQVRIDFVNPFFKSLGWDVDNEKGLPQHLREVTHEAAVSVEERGYYKTKKPDYMFKVGTEPLFYLETKKPSVDITRDRSPAYQLRRYGWSGNLKISVLTNYTDLYIYDCTVRPVEGDDVGVALIAHFSYTEYEEKFDEIYRLLSKETVLSGQFDKIFGNIQGAFKREPFDEYFLTQIREWRTLLGKDIISQNLNIDKDTLNICIQRFLNRIIFLRICDDRNLEKYGTLKHITTYEYFKKLFKKADQKYNSGLFETLEEDQYVLSNSVILNIFHDLYYPNSSYEFSVVDPYIIGQIYEMFLDEELKVDQDGNLITIEKPEAIDSQGAVNTPKNITDIIVEQTLTPLYSGKSFSEVEHYRIADICCGSGNFLLSAYEFIVNFYIGYLKEYECEHAVQRGDIYRLPGSSNYCLSYDIRRAILTKNIWGVDLDPMAVEVTKFSLLLKALEETTIEELSAYVKKTGARILPDLNHNIKNGNSLVDGTFAQFDPMVYRDERLLNKVKMFDWVSEFGNRKFDAIIGNPPYIRVQNMVHYSPEEYNFYKSKLSGYRLSESDLLDKYYLFIEKGLSLLDENGYLGYVVPHKFMNIQSGREMRQWLSENRYVKRMIHFGTFQAFKNRSTYTCILILSKRPQKEFEIAFVEDWNHFLFEHTAEFDRYPANYISGQPWIFLPHQISSELKKKEARCVPLRELAEIFVGVQTSADKIYIVHADSEDENYVIFTGKDGIQRAVEKGILRKSIYDAKLTKYEQIRANSYIIYPYQEMNGKTVLIGKDEMKQRYPLTYSYLHDFKGELDLRNMPGRTEDTWFAYGRSQSIKRFMKGEHLVWPVLSLDSNYVYDNEMMVFTGGGNGPFYGLEVKKTCKESIFYIQAVLNHWLMELLVKKKASTFRGGYYSHGKQFIAELPIYKIDFTNTKEMALHDKIVGMVKTMMDLSEQRETAGNRAARDIRKRAVDTIQQELERLIDELYGVKAQKEED